MSARVNRRPSRFVGQKIDRGIETAVRILQSHGIETYESCEGGEGHAYAGPTVEVVIPAQSATMITGFATEPDAEAWVVGHKERVAAPLARGRKFLQRPRTS